MKKTEIIPPETGEIDERATSALSLARGVAIAEPAHAEAAVAIVHDLRDLRKQIDETFDPVIRAAHAAHKSALAAKKKHAEPVDAAIAEVRSKIGAYEAEQRRIAAEAERVRREEEARLAKAAEEERQRRAAVETSPIPSSEPPPPPVPAEPPPPPFPEPTPEKTEGVTLRTKHVAVVEDLVALCRAIGEGRAPANLVRPDATALRKFATATKGTQVVDGVRFSTETETAIR